MDTEASMKRWRGPRAPQPATSVRRLSDPAPALEPRLVLLSRPDLRRARGVRGPLGGFRYRVQATKVCVNFLSLGGCSLLCIWWLSTAVLPGIQIVPAPTTNCMQPADTGEPTMQIWTNASGPSKQTHVQYIHVILIH